jgi:hypothetical protein
MVVRSKNAPNRDLIHLCSSHVRQLGGLSCDARPDHTNGSTAVGDDLDIVGTGRRLTAPLQLHPHPLAEIGAERALGRRRQPRNLARPAHGVDYHAEAAPCQKVSKAFQSTE